MDALFHLVFSLIGGYLLVKGLDLKYAPASIIMLSVLSLAVDADHFLQYAGIQGVSTHSLLIVAMPLAVYAAMLFTRSFEGKKEYFLILAVLFFGHISVDMIEGMYGTALFYPVSDRLYLIPENWEIYVNADPTEPIVATQGIGVTIYFGTIGLIIFFSRLLRPSKGSVKRTDTRI